MASNKGLGKGLGALLGDFSEEPVSDSAYRLLPIYKVRKALPLPLLRRPRGGGDHALL